MHAPVCAISVAEVRIVVGGNPTVLHAMTTAYLALCTTRPDLLQLVRFKFLLVPFAFNPLAGYIARYDSWYKYVPPSHTACVALAATCTLSYLVDF
jgi:hypothetical protein